MSVDAGIGRAAGNSLVGVTFGSLQRALPPPMNFAVGMAAFQLFFIPTGIMYWLASRSSPKDIGDVQHLLDDRATEAATHTHPGHPDAVTH